MKIATCIYLQMLSKINRNHDLEKKKVQIDFLIRKYFVLELGKHLKSKLEVQLFSICLILR